MIFSCSSVDGHLHCSHIMVSVNNTKKNLRVQACLWYADISSIGSCGFPLNRKDNLKGLERWFNSYNQVLFLQRTSVWIPTSWSIACNLQLTATCNSSSRGPYALFWPPWTSELLYVHTKRHTIKNKVFEGLHSSIYSHDAVVIYISSSHV